METHGAGRQNTKSRRKERKEEANMARLKKEVVSNSRSLDNLSDPPPDRNRGRRHGKPGGGQRRCSVQSDVLTQAPHQKQGNRKTNNVNNSNNNGRRGKKHLKRSASAADREPKAVNGRQPVRRTSSEGPRPRNFDVRDNPDSGAAARCPKVHTKRDTAKENNTGSRSTVTSAEPEWSGAKSKNMSSLTELFAVEVGLSPVSDVSVKESRRRRIVFAVVLVALALLTASVLLVAITLFLSPAVDEVLRKENENLFRLPTSTGLTTLPPPTATATFVENATTSGRAVG
ncbi:unnamed protein product [Ixodes persulcatus]